MMTLSRNRNRTRARAPSVANKVAVETNSEVAVTDPSEEEIDRAVAISCPEREEELAFSREAVTKDSDVVAPDSRTVEEHLAFKG